MPAPSARWLPVDALDDAAAINQALNLNVVAVMLLTSRFLAATRDLHADRRVLNISSGAGRNPTAGWGVYCATKAALDTLHARRSSRNRMRRRRSSRFRWPRRRRHRHAGRHPLQRSRRLPGPAAFPGPARQRQAGRPADVAARIAAYLDRDDFGGTEIDDIRNYN